MKKKHSTWKAISPNDMKVEAERSIRRVQGDKKITRGKNSRAKEALCYWHSHVRLTVAFKGSKGHSCTKNTSVPELRSKHIRTFSQDVQ